MLRYPGGKLQNPVDGVRVRVINHPQYKDHLGSVVRVTPGGYVEVSLDYPRAVAGDRKRKLDGIGLVAFRPADLKEIKKPKKR